MAGESNPFYVQPPNVLQSLMQFDTAFDSTRKRITESRQEDARKAAQEALLSGGDTRSALARLIGAGDVHGATALAQFGNQTLDQEYKKGMLDVARMNADSARVTATKSAPVIVPKIGLPDGRTQPGIVDPTTGNVTPIGSPVGDEVKLTSADRKAIFESEDDLAKLDSTIAAIKRAKDLNPKVFTGIGASYLGAIGTSGLPGVNSIIDKDRSAATNEWNQIMGGEAIKNMSATLKGASTDMELRKFVSLMADTSQPPQVREAAMNRVLQLAERQRQISADRMNQLRGGQYYKKDGGQSGSGGKPVAQTSELQEGQRARNPQTGQIIEYRDGKWSPVQ